MNNILITVLMEVTSFAQKVLTLPNSVTLKDLPGPEVTQDVIVDFLHKTRYQAFKTNIVAGRRPNQKHPRLGTSHFPSHFSFKEIS